VYGVFAFCPDCGVHNSLQILQSNLDLVLKQLELAEGLSDSDLARHLRENALEDCVSAFDGFARELCLVRAATSSDPQAAASLSFQNLPRAAKRVQQLFGIDLEATVPADDWRRTNLAFLRRHLLAHKAGVIDGRYLEDSGESVAQLGRRIAVTPADIAHAVSTTRELATRLFSSLAAAP
jgi:hypothetical protein